MTALIPPSSAVMMVVFSEDRKQTLLIKRADVGLYAFAGGAIDLTDANPEEAAIREFLEETGFETTIVRKVCCYTPFGPFSRLTHLYEGKIIGGSATCSSETKEVVFVPTDQLPPKLVPIYHDLLRDALDPECPEEKPMPRMYWIRDWRFVYNPQIFIPFLWGRLKAFVQGI